MNVPISGDNMGDEAGRSGGVRAASRARRLLPYAAGACCGLFLAVDVYLASVTLSAHRG